MQYDSTWLEYHFSIKHHILKVFLHMDVFPLREELRLKKKNPRIFRTRCDHDRSWVYRSSWTFTVVRVAKVQKHPVAVANDPRAVGIGNIGISRPP